MPYLSTEWYKCLDLLVIRLNSDMILGHDKGIDAERIHIYISRFEVEEAGLRYCIQVIYQDSRKLDLVYQ